jgi:hypothetical protein
LKPFFSEVCSGRLLELLSSSGGAPATGNDKCGWDSEIWVKWGLILRQLKEKRNFRKRVKIEEKAGYFSLFFFRQACPAHHNSTRAE